MGLSLAHAKPRPKLNLHLQTQSTCQQCKSDGRVVLASILLAWASKDLYLITTLSYWDIYADIILA